MMTLETDSLCQTVYNTMLSGNFGCKNKQKKKDNAATHLTNN